MMEYRVQNTEYRLTSKLGLSVKRSVSVTVCILFVLTVLLTGCRPRGILSSRQMRSVLVDLHKTDALLQVHGLHHGHDGDEDRYYAAVLEQHGVTQAQFDSSLVWYTHHPQLFDKIYPKVLNDLHKEYEEFVALHPESLEPPQPAGRPKKPSIEETHLRVDSLCWTMRNGGPDYGWHEGWKRPEKAPEIPFK